MLELVLRHESRRHVALLLFLQLFLPDFEIVIDAAMASFSTSVSIGRVGRRRARCPPNQIRFHLLFVVFLSYEPWTSTSRLPDATLHHPTKRVLSLTIRIPQNLLAHLRRERFVPLISLTNWYSLLNRRPRILPYQSSLPFDFETYPRI